MSSTILFFLLKLISTSNLITCISLPNRFYKYLFNFYISKPLWKLLNLLTYKDSGLLVNNLTYSYIYQNLSYYLNFMKLVEPKNMKNFSRINNNYFLPIKIVKLSFQKQLLNKLVVKLILQIQSINYPYLNYINISHSFFYLPKNISFFFFFNFFYFKIHNY